MDHLCFVSVWLLRDQLRNSSLHFTTKKSALLMSTKCFFITSMLCPSLQEQLNKQRAAEMRLEAERRRLREALEAAEARATRVELGRRSVEGELQRLKLSQGDREAESQASHERHDSLLKQVQHGGVLNGIVLAK